MDVDVDVDVGVMLGLSVGDLLGSFVGVNDDGLLVLAVGVTVGETVYVGMAVVGDADGSSVDSDPEG